MQTLSVNILTFNGSSAFIRYAIESVLPYSEDIIVFDTGSTDDTLEVLEGYPVTILKENVQFLGETWTNSPKDEKLTEFLNQLIKESSGDYILKIDDDEIYPPDLMREIISMKKTAPIYSLPFYHIGGSGKLNLIKRLFKNDIDIKWKGIYGTETLTYKEKRISSRKCPAMKNYFIHLGGLRSDLEDRVHRYGTL